MLVRKRTSPNAKPWMFLADAIVGFRTHGTDTL
jgi:phosphoenolpyruvate synthase/pyruvate phosphate dikinase